MALEQFIIKHAIPPLQGKPHLQWALTKGTVLWHEILCLFPLTYMNKSGSSIAAVAHYYKIDPAHILVVHDELDIPFGAIKAKIWWSAWWHNGVKSSEQSLWTQQFWRLRIWIDRPSTKEQVVNYVLQKFSWEEQTQLPTILDQAVQKMTDFCINKTL
jgi:PTH1 family peptidyl-tRNA hydrolase